MGLAYLGAIAVAFHGNPSFTFTSDPTAAGMQAATIAGLLEWDQAKQLKELVDNPGARVTIGNVTGVLEVIWPDDDLLGDFRGMYLFQQCQLNPQQIDSLTGLCPFTLTATLVGDDALREVIATRSARERTNDFDLAPTGLAAVPFFHEDADGGAFLVNPGGTRFTREYDASSPHDTARLTPAGDDARSLAIYAGAADPDALSPLLYPVLAPDDSGGIPPWVSKRGGDCRAHNRRSMRDVYGPNHRFEASTDCLVTNGLVRFWVGNRGLRPFLNVEAIADGTWREPGIVTIGSEDDRIVGHRLTKVTPDAVIVALAFAGKGEVLVTLKRGERMPHVDVPVGVTPADWAGTPPTSRALSAQNGPGRFGKGLDGGGQNGTWLAPYGSWAGDGYHSWSGARINPDLRFLWPPDVAPTAFGKVLWHTADTAVADLTDNSGFLTLYDASGFAIVEVYLDSADAKIKLRVNDVVKLTSAVQTFGIGDDLMLALRCSAANGLALSIRNHLGAVEHLVDATVTDLGPAALYDFAYWVNFARWGGDTWGDDVWGGVTHYPNGAIDNAMIFEDWLSTIEVEALAAAATALDGLPDPVGRMRWFGPFDAKPIVSLPVAAAGRRIDTVTDDDGFTKAVVSLDAAGTKSGVALARDATFDRAADHHDQLAAESVQKVRVG